MTVTTHTTLEEEIRSLASADEPVPDSDWEDDGYAVNPPLWSQLRDRFLHAAVTLGCDVLYPRQDRQYSTAQLGEDHRWVSSAADTYAEQARAEVLCVHAEEILLDEADTTPYSAYLRTLEYWEPTDDDEFRELQRQEADKWASARH